MKREDIQEDFRQQTKQPTMTLNKCEVGTNPKYVIWLEKRILALSIPRVVKSLPTNQESKCCGRCIPNIDLCVYDEDE